MESKSTVGDEWITPKRYIDLARKVMGSIDLDPASTEQANKIVKAKKFYTKSDNALDRQWLYKTLWMNPPYSYGLINYFVDKFLSFDPEEAIILTNSSTGTTWFHKLYSQADAVVFKKGRIAFIDPGTGEAQNNPRYDNVFFYFGGNLGDFHIAFREV